MAACFLFFFIYAEFISVSLLVFSFAQFGISARVGVSLWAVLSAVHACLPTDRVLASITHAVCKEKKNPASKTKRDSNIYAPHPRRKKSLKL
jgi:hypothetical protein